MVGVGRVFYPSSVKTKTEGSRNEQLSEAGRGTEAEILQRPPPPPSVDIFTYLEDASRDSSDVLEEIPQCSRAEGSKDQKSGVSTENSLAEQSNGHAGREKHADTW